MVHDPRGSVDGITQQIELAAAALLADLGRKGRAHGNTDLAADFRLRIANCEWINIKVHDDLADRYCGIRCPAGVVGVRGGHAKINHHIRAGKVVGHLFQYATTGLYSSIDARKSARKAVYNQDFLTFLNLIDEFRQTNEVDEDHRGFR